MEMKQALVTMLVTSEEELQCPVTTETLLLSAPVKSPGVWSALLRSMKRSDLAVRYSALEDVNGLLINSKANCESLRRCAGWQSWLYPLLTDISLHESDNKLAKGVYLLTMHTLACVHYSCFLHAPGEFEAELTRSLDALRQFGGQSSKTQALARTMLGTVISKLTNDLTGEDWRNFEGLHNLLVRFLFCMPEWADDTAAVSLPHDDALSGRRVLQPKSPLPQTTHRQSSFGEENVSPNTPQRAKKLPPRTSGMSPWSSKRRPRYCCGGSSCLLFV